MNDNFIIIILFFQTDGLSQSFIEAGRGLDILEDLCEEQEFHRRCLEEQRKLAMYKVQKEGEAERVKGLHINVIVIFVKLLTLFNLLF